MTRCGRCCGCAGKPWCAWEKQKVPWWDRSGVIACWSERVERLMTIPAVGPIPALTWALEVGDVGRFSSIKKGISYCRLCGAERSSANINKRTTLEATQQASADDGNRSGQDGARPEEVNFALLRGASGELCPPDKDLS